MATRKGRLGRRSKPKFQRDEERALDSGYAAYLEGAHWQNFRRMVLDLRPQCSICLGPSGVVHHKTYARLEAELESDVEALCFRCHKMLHQVHDRHGIPLAEFNRAAEMLRSPKVVVIPQRPLPSKVNPHCKYEKPPGGYLNRHTVAMLNRDGKRKKRKHR